MFIGHLCLISLEEIDSVVKVLQKRKPPKPPKNDFTDKLKQKIKDNIIPILHKLLHEIVEGRLFPTHFMGPTLLCYQNQQQSKNRN